MGAYLRIQRVVPTVTHSGLPVRASVTRITPNIRIAVSAQWDGLGFGVQNSTDLSLRRDTVDVQCARRESHFGLVLLNNG